MLRLKPLQFAAATSAMLCTGAAFAEQCNFTLECFEGDGCSETSFDFSIEDGQMISDAETVPVTQTGTDDTRVYTGQTSSAFHVVTKASDGSARYSTHLFDGPLMINYIGTCE